MDKFVIRAKRTTVSSSSNIDMNLDRSNESQVDINVIDIDVRGSSSPKRARTETICDEDIVSDPALRKPIKEYDHRIRDVVRREYVVKGPCQPISHDFKRSQFGKISRRFQAEWFKNRDWLEYSVSKDAAFCFWCYLFGEVGKKNGDEVFVKTGFRNWKKAFEKFKDHVGLLGSIHNDARMQFFAFKDQRQSLTRKLTLGKQQLVEAYHIRLTTIVDVARLLINQGLSSHNSEVEKVVRENAPLNHQLTSPSIQKDIIKACASKTIKVIMSEIGDKFFSLLVDEARDSSMKEQMIVLRYNAPTLFSRRAPLTYYTLLKTQILHQVNDRIVMELESRFGETSTELLICASSLDSRDSFSRFNESNLSRMAELYPHDFTVNNLFEFKVELKLWIRQMRQNEKFSNLQSIGALGQKMIKIGIHNTFPLVYRLIELALVMPVATATVERVFFAMNFIKTDLHNKMGDEFLTDALVCYVERDIFKNIDNEVILQHFQNLERVTIGWETVVLVALVVDLGLTGIASERDDDDRFVFAVRLPLSFSSVVLGLGCRR
ncbi:hypothetical protein V2J09_021849 [Rumex salicifolius]